MKEIRIENGSMYFERLIQVTKNPKGEQRSPKVALKRVYQKVIVISFVHLEKLCRFAKFGGHGSKIRLATPILVLRYNRPYIRQF